MKRRIGCVLVGFLSLVLSLVAQTSGVSPASAQVPPLIQFSNVATDEGGNSLSGVVNITFSLYNSQRGGEPLWTETQNNVQLDSTGHYSVQLGITKPNGVPAALFTSGEARWLGVQIADEAEQPRVAVECALRVEGRGCGNDRRIASVGVRTGRTTERGCFGVHHYVGHQAEHFASNGHRRDHNRRQSQLSAALQRGLIDYRFGGVPDNWRGHSSPRPLLAEHHERWNARRD